LPVLKRRSIPISYSLIVRHPFFDREKTITVSFPTYGLDGLNGFRPIASFANVIAVFSARMDEPGNGCLVSGRKLIS
jgi:hypothetical protein